MSIHDPREIVKHINSRNAKILAVFVVIGFIGYHGILHLTSGSQYYYFLQTFSLLINYNHLQIVVLILTKLYMLFVPTEIVLYIPLLTMCYLVKLYIA